MTSSTSGRSQPIDPALASVAPTTFPDQSAATLVDAVDHLLDRGAVLVGEATISLAGVDLIYVGLNLLVSSVETLRAASSGDASPPRHLPFGEEKAEEGVNRSGSVLSQRKRDISPSPPWQPAGSASFHPPPSPISAGTGEREEKDPTAQGGGERPEQGLARLVLTLVELLRQLLERQAVRRMEGGTLTEEDLERMGVALLELEQKMAELREVFGLEEADLNLDLGPLGRLL